MPHAADPSAREAAALQQLCAMRLLRPAQVEEVVAAGRRGGVALPDILSATYQISGYTWAKALAASAGEQVADLNVEPPDPALLHEADRDLYLRLMFVPWKRRPDGVIVLAARNPDDPALHDLMARRHPDSVFAYVPTGKFDVIWAVQKQFDSAMSVAAHDALFNRSPEMSAKTTTTPAQQRAMLIALAVVILCLCLRPHQTLVLLCGLMSTLYTILFLFRGILTIIGSGRRSDLSVSRAEVAELREQDLPIYTVLVPMYRETEVLPILVDSMRKLDYPRGKLDVKLVLEASDTETIEAAKALGVEDIFEIIRVPPSHPKTKPKACNYALGFARGAYTVVFDAEDIPEPDQLKKVVALFRASSPEVACIQARLNYFNREDNFLTRMFTLEYSHWFDYLLPGLHYLNLPIPLGGTSNHFRTDVLVGLGAWDPYNVTEDADLGVRLTQEGYRVAVVNSTTFEEANGILTSWVNQRSRWIKGYMQTWLVHMRHPVQLFRRLGFVGFVGFQMFIGFPPFTALINPVLWAMFGVSVFIGPDQIARLFPPSVLTMALFDLLIGNAMYVYFNVVAASKRKWFGLVPWGLLAPAYWVLHSVAAYKALKQLITNPHYWEKTTHGTSAKTRETIAAITTVEFVEAAE